MSIYHGQNAISNRSNCVFIAWFANLKVKTALHCKNKRLCEHPSNLKKSYN